MNKLTYYIAVLTVSILLSGCASLNQSLEQPLPKQQKIAVVSVMGNEAQFNKMGLTIFGNVKFKHTVPGLDMNDIANRAALKNLRAKGYINSFKISHASNDSLASIPTPVARELPLAYRQFLKKVVAKYHANTILLITNGLTRVDTDGQYNPVMQYGYGIYAQKAFSIERQYIVAGFNLFLINASDLRTMAYSAADIGKVPTKGKIEWQDKYAGVSSVAKQNLKRTISAKFASAIGNNLNKLGL